LVPVRQASAHDPFELRFLVEPSIIENEPGTTVQFTAVVQLSQAAGAVSGWSLSVTTGDPATCSIIEATTAAVDPAFELMNERTRGPGNEGWVSIVELDEQAGLDPDATPHDLLRLTLEATVGRCFICTLKFMDGLKGNDGNPVRNRVVSGKTEFMPVFLNQVVPRGADLDCNDSSIPDGCEIALGLSEDCNNNNVPDECDPDSDGDTAPDDCDDCPNDRTRTKPGPCGCGPTSGFGEFDCLLAQVEPLGTCDTKLPQPLDRFIERRVAKARQLADKLADRMGCGIAQNPKVRKRTQRLFSKLAKRLNAISNKVDKAERKRISTLCADRIRSRVQQLLDLLPQLRPLVL
jgi:hypothetical protein